MTTVVSFSQNIALLLSLTFLYGFIYPRLESLSRQFQRILNGLLFGLFAVISMLQPVQIAPGVIFDGRSIVVIFAALYGGLVPVSIATLMVVVFRLSLGGVGTFSGIGSVACAASLGMSVYRYYQRHGSRPDASVLALIGLAQALIGGFWTLLVPGGIGLSLAQTTLPLTLVFYPLGMLLLGKLLDNQRQSLEMERTQRDQERRFHAIFDRSYQFVGLLKPDGTLLEANQTALDFGGVQRADVINHLVWDTYWWTISPETQAQLKDAVRRAAQGEFVHYEVDVWNAQKRPTTIDFTLKPIRDESGQVVLLIPEGRDISERKELEQQRFDLTMERERSRLLKKFISDVSHDLRTPLAVIRLNLDMLQRTTDPQKQQKRIDALVGQEKHLTHLLTDMMAMLTLDDGDAELTFKPVDINVLAQFEIDTHEAEAKRKQQKLILSACDAPVLVEGDQVELEHALNRLLGNALSYTPEGGTITLAVSRDDPMAVLEIRDTGIGVAPEDLALIFQRFYRADRARSMDTGGTGLGLPIARRIVELHKGRIEVESVPDAGSTFRVLLPLIAPDGDAADPGVPTE